LGQEKNYPLERAHICQMTHFKYHYFWFAWNHPKELTNIGLLYLFTPISSDRNCGR